MSAINPNISIHSIESSKANSLYSKQAGFLLKPGISTNTSVL